MADEQNIDLQSSAHEAALREEKPRNRRTLWGLVVLVILIVLVVLLLLLLRDCGGGRDAGDAATKTIEAVEGLEPVPGVISVWLKPDVDVEQAISDAGIEASDALDMGEGRYVLQVTEGSEDQAVEAVAALGTVYDAGLVYQQPDAGK